MALKIETTPPTPSFAVTALAMVIPDDPFRFEDAGGTWPAGHSVRYDEALVSVTVTFSTTASASAGTSRCVPAPHALS